MWDLFIAGGPVMWPLLLCSIVALTVIVERTWFWCRLDLDRDRQGLEDLLEDYRLRRTPATGAGQRLPPGAVARMLLCGLAHREYSASKAMEGLALDELKAMRRGMNILDTLITAAPMLGILGTVMGIIASFDILGMSGVDDPQSVVSGIAEALITTAAGLIIAVAVVFPFNYFNSRIEDAQDKFESWATRLEILMEHETGADKRD